MRYRFKSLVIISMMLFAANTLAGSCPDYDPAQNPPNLTMPDKEGFRKWQNIWLSQRYKPYHMIHDSIAVTGSTAVVVGKFDYDYVLHKDLEGEDIKVYIYGTDMPDWEYIGEYRTNTDGKINVSIDQGPGEYRVRMVVLGDLSVVDGYLSVVDPGRETVLFDVDGTLTLGDLEVVGEWLGIDDADAYPYAVQVVNEYINKGYQIVYLTGRSYWITEASRSWFDNQGLLPWHYHSKPGSIDTEQYKTDYLNYLINDVGLNIVRAYGNASTDIAAYESAGIDKAQTFIIGSNAGGRGTQAIKGDYSKHYADIVLNTPAVNCH
ncbi:putative acid phosphatase of HAD superfamily subfamily IIIB [Sinobacterium caligoides]|uniref:Putative acid phosphatase of HAD superfamily subfamily IIIB n=1 Tax=Sinobacterium caligoides TaxID=933926 RepID=A0A3N2DEQ3_9GAMM|nr:HAD family acid phosphatase [Sinobacterium caligoides]ROR97904.1 putative acid phosphatase of HAD superfamily subfamily IIIB [Sinobacterium caligoides]